MDPGEDACVVCGNPIAARDGAYLVFLSQPYPTGQTVDPDEYVARELAQLRIHDHQELAAAEERIRAAAREHAGKAILKERIVLGVVCEGCGKDPNDAGELRKLLARYQQQHEPGRYSGPTP